VSETWVAAIVAVAEFLRKAYISFEAVGRVYALEEGSRRCLVRTVDCFESKLAMLAVACKGSVAQG
jgi:hypothetical protein